MKCKLCNGHACEEGCGLRGQGCEMAFSGPDSHKICTRCHGSGIEYQTLMLVNSTTGEVIQGWDWDGEETVDVTVGDTTFSFKGPR